jgi:hypothetical protein
LPVPRIWWSSWPLPAISTRSTPAAPTVAVDLGMALALALAVARSAGLPAAPPHRDPETARSSGHHRPAAAGLHRPPADRPSQPWRHGSHHGRRTPAAPRHCGWGGASAGWPQCEPGAEHRPRPGTNWQPWPPSGRAMATVTTSPSPSSTRSRWLSVNDLPDPAGPISEHTCPDRRAGSNGSMSAACSAGSPGAGGACWVVAHSNLACSAACKSGAGGPHPPGGAM